LDSEPAVPTPTPEGGPLGNVSRSKDVLNENIVPARSIALKNSLGELVSWMDPAAARGKSDPSRTVDFSALCAAADEKLSAARPLAEDVQDDSMRMQERESVRW